MSVGTRQGLLGPLAPNSAPLGNFSWIRANVAPGDTETLRFVAPWAVNQQISGWTNAAPAQPTRNLGAPIPGTNPVTGQILTVPPATPTRSLGAPIPGVNPVTGQPITIQSVPPPPPSTAPPPPPSGAPPPPPSSYTGTWQDIDSAVGAGGGQGTTGNINNGYNGVQLAIPYDWTKDKARWDWSTWKNAQSSWSRVWSRVNSMMQQYPGTDPQAALTWALSVLKHEVRNDPAKRDSTGFDLSQVPDNFGVDFYTDASKGMAWFAQNHRRGQAPNDTAPGGTGGAPGAPGVPGAPATPGGTPVANPNDNGKPTPGPGGGPNSLSEVLRLKPEDALAYAQQAAGINPKALGFFGTTLTKLLAPLVQSRMALMNLRPDGQIEDAAQILQGLGSSFMSATPGDFTQGIRDFGQYIGGGAPFKQGVNTLADMNDQVQMYQNLLPLLYQGANPLTKEAALQQLRNAVSDIKQPFYTGGPQYTGTFGQFMSDRSNTLDPILQRLFGGQ